MKFYRVYISLAAYFIACLFAVSQWKHAIIKSNLRLCGISSFSIFHFYQNLARDLLIFLHGKYPGPLKFHKNSLPHFKRLQTSGGLLLCAHFHNWELMGSWLVAKGLPLKGFSQPLTNKWADKLLNKLRKKINLPTVSEMVSLEALKWINDQKVFGVLADQRYSKAKTLHSFFGQPVTLTPLPAFLSKQSKLPVYFSFSLPDGTIRWMPLVTNSKVTAEKMISRYHRCLTTIIKAYPELWYGWAHNRFKNDQSFQPSKTVSRETIFTQQNTDTLFHVKPKGGP